MVPITFGCINKIGSNLKKSSVYPASQGSHMGHVAMWPNNTQLSPTSIDTNVPMTQTTFIHPGEYYDKTF